MFSFHSQGNRLGNLLNGMILDDIEHLDPASVFEGVTTMGRAKFDQSQTHQIMSKVRFSQGNNCFIVTSNIVIVVCVDPFRSYKSHLLIVFLHNASQTS